MTPFNMLNALANLPPATLEAIKAMASAAPMQAAIAELDAQWHSRRVQAAADLQECGAKHAAQIAATSEALAAADARLNRARAELDAARDAYAEAQRSYTAASMLESHDRGRLQAALKETADPRLALMLEALAEVRQATNASVMSTPGRTADGKMVSHSNIEGVSAAVAKINDAATLCAEAQMGTATRAEITTLLRDTVDRVNRAVGGLSNLVRVGLELSEHDQPRLTGPYSVDRRLRAHGAPDPLTAA